MSDLQARLQTALGDAYRIERELGGGGMSRLFLANEASLRRQVVVKVLPPEFASEVSAARFNQEIELAAHLQHPNVLPVLTADAREDLLYYVMPYVAGESLRHRLTREGKLPVPDAVQILHEVADALAYAHAEGVIHRDIKPENILLEGAHAVLTDFGVARALVEARSGGRLTETGISLGTPAYMSPEQAAGERHLDARADVYALAVVGYEMLAGFPPFAGPTAQAVIAAHLTATPRPLVDVRADTPPAVSEAIMRALAKDPGARLRTAAEFRDAVGGAYARAGPRGLSKRARVAAGITAGAIAAGAALLLLRPKAPAALDPNLLAVAPFDVLAPNLELWREGLVDVLSRNLDGAGPLRTVSPTVVIRRWSGRADPASATELGRRTGARLVVFGGIEGAGPDSVRMSATVFDVGSGSALAEVQLPGASARMDRLGDSLTVAVLRELGRTRPIGAVRLASLGSTSLPAVKAFLRGEQFYRRGVYDSALAEYQRAVALDSSFTLALARIPLALWWRPSDTSWVAYMLRAGRHNRGLAPRESLLVTIDSLWGATWGRIPGLSLIRRLTGTIDEGTRRYPDDPELWYHRGEVGHHWGGWSLPQITAQQALEAFERSIALDSAFAPAYEHVSELALRLRGPAAARRYIRGYLALAPSPAEAAGLRILEKLLAPDSARSPEVARLLDTLSGDALWRAWYQVKGWTDSGETAVRLARSFAAARHGFRDIDSSQAGLPLARTLAYRGHLREAYRSLGLTGEGFGWKNAFTELALLGAVPRDSAAATFGRWLRANNGGWGLAWWGATGDTGSIHELARRADSLSHFSKPDERGFWHYLAAATQPYLALTRHDTTEAIRRFATLPDSLCRGCYYERLVRVQLLSLRGKDQEVALLPDEELHEPDLITPSEALWALERGRVNERLGRREKAVQAYSFVADVWRNADPELQPYVQEAKAALKRLGGEPRRN